MCSVIGKPLG
jgi:hypothetical protein